ncbi:MULTISPECIES: hypothetical protein [unclassified Cyanobium]|uniref:hypothetical protein n=1 Tax=unclassified Cyanobium TaxID=2627006 RepID=UPI0020CBFE2F|nr:MULTISPECIES: hypothetical protein [unclassified Cyanobium]MCP9859230.1 hypothetical protein [Cyanobium sp. Cruz-8H5]MCP9866378.1 hypothetical protein [Cyanobium sp. Cruz-8D1]
MVVTTQRRLALPFELVYDQGHPQADLAWARQPAIAAVPPIALLYLYATPTNGRQQQLLAQLLPLAPMGRSPSRVQMGVFRDTPRGRRLLAAQQQQLQALAMPYEQVRFVPGAPVPAASFQPPESMSLLPESDLR